MPTERTPSGLAVAQTGLSFTTDALIVVGRVLRYVASLPKAAKRSVASAMGCSCAKRRANIGREICAKLLKLPLLKIQRFMRRMNIAKDDEWTFAEREGADLIDGSEDEGADLVDVERMERLAVLNLVRTGLSACVEGDSDTHFLRQLSRLQLAGATLVTSSPWIS